VGKNLTVAVRTQKPHRCSEEKTEIITVAVRKQPKTSPWQWGKNQKIIAAVKEKPKKLQKSGEKPLLQ